jgi:transposase
MEVMIERCAGLDVHMRSVTACVRTPGSGRQRRRSVTRTFMTFAAALIELRDWLVAEGVTAVAMEATGVYWQPVWDTLEHGGFDMKLVNPQHIKAVPGRKTDVKDAEWIAQLLECGLLNGSFVPPREIRELRDLTRYRRRLVEGRARQERRLGKQLEGAHVKLASVVSDLTGVTARLILNALCDGVRDPDALAEMAQRKLRAKIADLRQAVPGRFNEHHGFMVREILAQIDSLDAAIARLDLRVAEVMAGPFGWAKTLLMTIPGIKTRNAEIIIAEIGVDMTRFPTADHLASWAGVCPGNRESAGKQRSGATRHGDPWLCSALVEAAWSASKTRGTSMQTRFWRIARKRGPNKAAMAVAHHLLIVIWHLLNDRVAYHELGADYLARRDDPARKQRYLVHELERMGLKVTIEPTAA